MVLQKFNPRRSIDSWKKSINQFPASQSVFRFTRSNDVDCCPSRNAPLGCIHAPCQFADVGINLTSAGHSFSYPPLNVGGINDRAISQLDECVDDLALMPVFKPTNLDFCKSHQEMGNRKCCLQHRQSGCGLRFGYRQVAKKVSVHAPLWRKEGLNEIRRTIYRALATATPLINAIKG